jgi:hypothetical protein
MRWMPLDRRNYFCDIGQVPIAGLHQVPDLGALTTQIQKNVEVRYQQVSKLYHCSSLPYFDKSCL